MASVAVPPRIERALRSLRSVSACEIEGAPKFAASAKRWVVTLALRTDQGGPFVGTRTSWCVLLDETYPYGSVGFYPAAEGGITATFPHMERNQADGESRGWRAGKLCLDSPFRGKRRPTDARDPIGDADVRLRWHVERALNWLERAAQGKLLATGDPFELPSRPPKAGKGWLQKLVVHDETAAAFGTWAGSLSGVGLARLGVVTGLANTIGVAHFEGQDGTTLRSWTGRPLDKRTDGVQGVWWLWRKPIVLPPWQSPSTWGDLRRIGQDAGFSVDAELERLAPSLRGSKSRTLLLLGYPIPGRVGEPPREVHWDALLLPELPASTGNPPRGYRANPRGWWHRDRHEAFADKKGLEYLLAENWSGERLQARGRLSTPLREARVAILGVGALGSCLAEQLVRTGLGNIALFDGDLVAAGNVCRHTATLADVGKTKVRAVGERLLQISPHVVITEGNKDLVGDQRAIEEALEPYDVVIDCTASDGALSLLATGWWSVPRVFASFSMGFGAQRLFSFGVAAHEFPQQRFIDAVGPWLRDEAITWAVEEELLEGAGCWSPLFPARYDDVTLAAAICVKEIEALVSKKPREPRLHVFEKQNSADGFHGFSLQLQVPTPQSATP